MRRGRPRSQQKVLRHLAIMRRKLIHHRLVSVHFVSAGIPCNHLRFARGSKFSSVGLAQVSKVCLKKQSKSAAPGLITSEISPSRCLKSVDRGHRSQRFGQVFPRPSDTVYAEGQRRYVESLSAYARQFLERMDNPTSTRCAHCARDCQFARKTPRAILVQPWVRRLKSTITCVCCTHVRARPFARVWPTGLSRFTGIDSPMKC